MSICGSAMRMRPKATATRPLPDPLTGTAFTAEEVQRDALAAIADLFATVATKVDSLRD
jgi:hypothetical protein